jgi:glycosyltransferase involved in cell wall biosynthesis
MMRNLSTTKILMTTDTLGGVWTYATDLAKAFAKSGTSVHLVTIGPKPRADQRAALSGSAVEVIESDLALEWQDPEGRDLARACRFLADVEHRIRPDIVHLNSYREATFDWHASVVVAAHSCVNSWGLACNDSSWLLEPSWQRYTELVTAGLDQAETWVAPTQAFRDVMGELYRPRSPGAVIANGAVLASKPATPKKPFIVAAGRMWDRAKNLSALAEVAIDLDWPVFVAGATGSGRETSSGLCLLGELTRPQLHAQMQRAAIFASPAHYEPFGLAVLEAAAEGCALVLSDIPSFRELWNGAAVFVAPDDIHGLRTVLADLCNDPDKRAQLQHAAFAKARCYSIRQTADRYAQLYRSLIAPRSTAGLHAVEAHA